MGLNETLTQLMMESSAGSCNHQYSMYYVKRYIEEVVRFSSQENCLDILQSCCEKDKAKELQSCLSTNDLLEHKSLEYWLNFYVDFVNDHVNDYINIGSHEKTQGVWLTNNISGGNGTKKIKYINLQHDRVGPFVAGDSSLQLLLRNTVGFMAQSNNMHTIYKRMESYCKGIIIKTFHMVMGRSI